MGREYQAPAADPGGRVISTAAGHPCLPAPEKQVQGPRIPTPHAQTLDQSQDCRPLSYTAAPRASPSEAPLATRRQAGLLGSRSDAMATAQADICARDGVGRGSPTGNGMRMREERRAGLAGWMQDGLGKQRGTCLKMWAVCACARRSGQDAGARGAGLGRGLGGAGYGKGS